MAVEKEIVWGVVADVDQRVSSPAGRAAVRAWSPVEEEKPAWVTEMTELISAASLHPSRRQQCPDQESVGVWPTSAFGQRLPQFTGGSGKRHRASKGGDVQILNRSSPTPPSPAVPDMEGSHHHSQGSQAPLPPEADDFPASRVAVVVGRLGEGLMLCPRSRGGGAVFCSGDAPDARSGFSWSPLM